MAYVAISRDLIGRVSSKISGMENAEVKALGEEPKVVMNPEHPTITQMLWGEHANLRNLMPKEWVNTTDSIYGVLDIDTGGQDITRYRYNFALSSEAIAPPNYSRYGGNLKHMSPDVPEFREIYEFAKRRVEITNRWNNVKSKVTAFLDQCKSLNEAVKTWPDVALYVDKSDLERLEVKRGKAEKSSAAKEALASMNVDELVGAVVIARMSGAA